MISYQILTVSSVPDTRCHTSNEDPVVNKTDVACPHEAHTQDNPEDLKSNLFKSPDSSNNELDIIFLKSIQLPHKHHNLVIKQFKLAA